MCDLSRYNGIKIGYWFPSSKKWFLEMKEEADQLGVELVLFDFSSRCSLPGVLIDALYWKTRYLARPNPELDPSLDAHTLLRFRNFLGNPSCYYLGPPSNGCTVHRLAMKKLWDALDISVATPGGEVRIKQPAWHFLAPETVIAATELRYPMIAKPINATSHTIALIYNALGLDEFRQAMKLEVDLNEIVGYVGSFTLEEFHNHSGVIYKLYVLGDKYWIYTRPSFPNVDANCVPTDKDGRLVNYEVPTVRVSRGKGKEQLDGKNCDLKNSDDLGVASLSPIPESAIRLLMAYVKEHADGLDVFGVDLIRSDASLEYFVIDINFAPSYGEVPNGHSLLLHHILDETLKIKQDTNLPKSS